MLVLLGIGVLAGVVTAVSPCVLPVLPILLAGGASGRKPLRRPYEGWLGRFRHVSAAYAYRGGDAGSQALGTTQELVDELDRAFSSAEPGTVCASIST